MGERGHPHRGSRDTNEIGIINALRQLGATVKKLDNPCDLVVGWRSINILGEVKLPPSVKGGTSHSELTKEEATFHRTWRGQVAVWRTPQEAVAYVIAYTNEMLQSAPDRVSDPG